MFFFFFFFKQKTAYEIRKGDWSSDVCSSDLREAHRQRVLLRKLLAERDADVFRVAPRHHFGISTTTSPRTTAWQPSREWIVRPSAVSSRSSSSSCISERFSSPSFTTTWHVVQAHEP